MTKTVEEELRAAYALLPQGHRDPAEVLDGSRRSAMRLRRRRAAGMCAGALAATLVIGATAVIGTGLGSPAEKTVQPAASSQSTARVSFSTSPPAAKHTSSATSAPTPPFNKEGTDKPLAGLSGKLLPHGSQLPKGMSYQGLFTTDYWKTWDMSLSDGYANVVPVLVLTGADQNFDAPAVAQTEAAYGILAGVSDMATTSGTSGGYLDSSVVRFRTPELAQSAIAKVRRHEPGFYWVWKQQTTPNVPWQGVPGVTGEHGVYNLPAGTPQPLIVAYQVVGEYIVAADSETAATAEQGVIDIVANLKADGLLK